MTRGTSQYWLGILALCLLFLVGLEAQFDLQTAKTQVKYAMSAYCPPNQLNQWNCTHCNSETVGLKVTQILTGYDDMAGYVGVNHQTSSIVVAFRGSSNLENWIANLQFFKTDFPYPGVAGAYVHSGFYKIWLSMSQTVINEVSKLVAQYPKYQVYVTGHSLGGAMGVFATLTIRDLLISDVVFYSFGCPRVGNIEFSNYFNQVASEYRSVHYNDLVPHLPPFEFGFHHPITEVWFSQDQTTYKECNSDPNGGGEDPTCSDSLVFLSVAAHLNYLGESAGC